MTDEKLLHFEERLKRVGQDVSELKLLQKELIEIIKKNVELEQKMIHANEKHDEGRRVLHKRIDLLGKIFFWFGTTLFTGMAGVIFTLVQATMKG
ncbi:MAG: Unknown protein [uncultured Sulfurovum sp.]|uniref:Uncharacterized protein n=1 Tax=uncultured Sulfurovum sp. TaxID=269237 RepID=A0A6S6SEG3_9BACT|nr:MAG: Unknown protein [uncultured Sulfurovum sp.]